MPDLLIELLSEEIPARMQAPAADNLLRLVSINVKENGLKFENAYTYYSARRLVLILYNLDAYSKDVVEEKLGPRIDAPERAIKGFLDANNLSTVDQCNIKSDVKGDRYSFLRKIPKRDAEKIVSQIMCDTIKSFPWPKSMKWGNGNLRWVRPLKNILGILISKNNTTILDFEIDNIKATNITYGHRFMANESIKIHNIDQYHKALREHYVDIDIVERKRKINEQASLIMKDRNIMIHEDEPLLNEVAGLVEWPIVLLGKFDDKFLMLPEEVLITSMRNHQKYFSVFDKKTNKMTNNFLVVSNIESQDLGKSIINGNQRVLSARLYDALYFWENDLKTKLEDRVAGLKNVIFHEKLGTLYSRVNRIKYIATQIAKFVGANIELVSRAAYLSKADLQTGMVSEFPELQGTIGRYYAIEQGEDSSVADAIKEHYLPVGSGDLLPSSPVSISLSLAEKIDMLVSFWIINEKPTGSKDPFALRRSANGIIRIIIESQIEVPIRQIIKKSQDILSNEIDSDCKDVSADLINFLLDRLRTYMREYDIGKEVIDATIHGQKIDDFYLLSEKIKSLNNFIKSIDGIAFIKAIRRVHNILQLHEKKKDCLKIAGIVNESLFEFKEEKELYKVLTELSHIDISVYKKRDKKIYEDSLLALSEPINNFFDAVIVNVDKKDIKENRLSLLAGVRIFTQKIADFSIIDS